MKFANVILAALAALVLSGQAVANPKLADEKQCMQCHSADKDGTGPSFRTIKAIYQRMEQPEAMLVAVIRDGSDANLGPHWGKSRMPNGSERPRIDDREAKLLARWILD